MPPSFRKLALTGHIISSIGWLGAVIGFLALVLVALISKEPQIVRSVYVTMELLGWFAIVPLAIVSFLTGLIMSLGTKWGLFRHYWVLFKLFLTLISIFVLLLNMKTVSFLADKAGNLDNMELAGLQGELLHSGGGLLILFVITILSIYKPKGLTRYGTRKLARSQT